MKLSDVTKNHYEDLISQLGDEYIYHRWKKNPVSSSHYYQTLKSIEFAFSNILASGLNILEIGPGPGTWSDICFKYAKTLTVVDISTQMLKVLAEKYKDADMSMHCGDFLLVDFHENQYDMIFSARALEYMDNKHDVIIKSANLLRKNGWLIIITKNPYWIDKKNFFIENEQNYDSMHNDWISQNLLKEYFVNNGFVNVRIFPVAFGSYHFSPQ
jgi:ubiquinone/menaquinone biosynthesis C-methylase UbiE